MLVGIMGKMGAGKTESMSVLSEYLAIMTGAPLWANYSLTAPIPAGRITSVSQIWQMEAGIFCFDEIWLTMDSRLWKDNVALSRWVNQTRKKKMIVFYTTQHISQVELRVRNATDILIFCEKRHGNIWLHFLDWQYGTIGKKFLLEKPERFYSIYDTYETLQPLTMR